MKKLALSLTTAALILGINVLSGNAQTQAPGAANLHAQIQNTTPIVKQVDCRGGRQKGACPPDFIKKCGPAACKCVRCRY